ncbi:hypothetical protein EON65_48170 [archaeon]|nr:MAG: hypothetical protein EON65_48170 [archaeon]
METIQDDYDNSLSDRAIKHLQGLGLPMFETQGLMRHILDCLGTLKVRLEEDSVVAPHLLTIFTDSLKIFADHLSGFDPIDSESGVKYLVQAFPDDNKRRDGRAWLPVHLAAANHNVDPEVLEAVVKERPMHLLKVTWKTPFTVSSHVSALYLHVYFMSAVWFLLGSPA